MLPAHNFVTIQHEKEATLFWSNNFMRFGLKFGKTNLSQAVASTELLWPAKA